MDKQTMIEEKTNLDAWYHYAAHADGFIGACLRTQRERTFTTQEQQRNLLGILDGKYDQLWLRMQAMPIPRANQFMKDMGEIVTHVRSDVGADVSIDRERLGELIQNGLE